MSRRWLAGRSDHAGKAASAASTAASASGIPAEEALWITLLVEGLVTSIVLEVVTSLPLIWRGTTSILTGLYCLILSRFS